MTQILTRAGRRSRFLLDWSADYCLERPDRLLTALTGQAATFARAYHGTMIDAAGRLNLAAHSEPRFEWVDLDGDGIRETPGLLLEGSRTNLVLQSENFGTTWAAVGTPTRTAAAKKLGILTLDLIGDNDAAALEGYTQTVTFTGNAAKAVSCYLAAGTSTSTVVRLRDTTAGADRLLAVITWSAGVPIVAMTTGTNLGGSNGELLSDGVYRFRFQTTTATAANVNSVQLYPATTSGLAVANTGTVYAGGVQAEDALFSSSYVSTTTAPLTRTADNFSLVCNVVPRALTLYGKGRSLQGSNFDGSFLAALGTAGGTRFTVHRTSGAASLTGTHSSAAGTVTSAAAATVAINDLLEWRAVLAADGSIQQFASVNGAAETSGSASAANALDAAWAAQTLHLNQDPTPANQGFLVLFALRLAVGAEPIAVMRAA